MKRLVMTYLIVIVLAFGFFIVSGITSDVRAQITIPDVELINDALNLDNLETAYNPGDSRAPAGVFTIDATFTNISASSFFDVFFEVAILTGGNSVLNSVGSNGVGSIVEGTSQLAPGESFDVVFEIGLQEASPFQFFVDAFGTPN
jgi:hypothetical protein